MILCSKIYTLKLTTIQFVIEMKSLVNETSSTYNTRQPTTLQANMIYKGNQKKSTILRFPLLVIVDEWICFSMAQRTSKVPMELR